MNKKIKQFSEQAIHDDNGETLHFLPNPRYIEKFSNLIIQECIRLCDEIEDDYLKGEDRNTDIGVGAGTCAYEIEKHFGVE